MRFKNQGLDVIEVQDNGSGISPANHASVALKHHTSKLTSYSDIASLQTFGFRGEALSSLCALSNLTIVTCLPADAPKGSKLTFESSGEPQSTTIVAAQKGTTVYVESLFHNLPVRRRELGRNIKREYQKVIALLNQYACIQTDLKFSVSQQPTKGKRILLFSTRGNPTTRENIINIFGAKTMQSLVSLDLSLEMQSSTLTSALSNASQLPASKLVRVIGHVSKPIHGDGRQTPDRQMFFVNGRPCGLPQFAKTFNEVYRSYNLSQSPFIFADIQLDTHMYDVNVSPDKRNILLHDQNRLLDSLRTSLIALFDLQDHSIPVGQTSRQSGADKGLEKSLKLSAKATSQQPSGSQEESEASFESDGVDDEDGSAEDDELPRRSRKIMPSKLVVEEGWNQNLISRWVTRDPSATSDLPNHSPSPSDVEEAGMTRESRSAIPVDTSVKDKELETRSAGHGTTDGDDVSEESHGQSQSSEAILNSPEPPIPAVQPLRVNRENPNNYSYTPRGTKRKSLATAPSVVIGDRIVTSLCSPTAKRGLIAPHLQLENEKTPNFGPQLSASFSADTRDSERRTNEMQGSSNEDSEMSAAESTPSATPMSDQNPEEQGPDISDQEPGSEVPETARRDIVSSMLSSDNEPEGHGSQSPEKGASLNAAEPRLSSLQGTVRRKDATVQLVQQMPMGESLVQSIMNQLVGSLSSGGSQVTNSREVEDISAPDAESRLPLIISRGDFATMRIVGQFNLGFIIAVCPSGKPAEGGQESKYDELFIIDQHASDEKFNFERLQDSTVVQSQRLVHPKRLQLTALEEEIVMQHMAAIESNGFKIDLDMSGKWPVGSRCQLIALPLSRETTFDLADFEELVALLGDSSSESNYIPRPSKVRKMFAMRACRSSVMIGKSLTENQMCTLVRHMGEMDKPWNCPHGRPTMRHLCRLQAWDQRGWGEDLSGRTTPAWATYLQG